MSNLEERLDELHDESGNETTHWALAAQELRRREAKIAALQARMDDMMDLLRQQLHETRTQLEQCRASLSECRADLGRQAKRVTEPARRHPEDGPMKHFPSLEEVEEAWEVAVTENRLYIFSLTARHWLWVAHERLRNHGLLEESDNE
jgi:chromosome segregation ATPase